MVDRTVKNAKSEQSSHVGAEEPTPGEEAKARAWLDAWVPCRGYRGEELARLDAERSLAVLLADERGARRCPLSVEPDGRPPLRRECTCPPSTSKATDALHVAGCPLWRSEFTRASKPILHAMRPNASLLCGSAYRDGGALNVFSSRAYVADVTCPPCRRELARLGVRVEPGGCATPCSFTVGQHAHGSGPMPSEACKHPLRFASDWSVCADCGATGLSVGTPPPAPSKPACPDCGEPLVCSFHQATKAALSSGKAGGS